MKYILFWTVLIIAGVFIWSTIRSIIDLKGKESIVTETKKEYEALLQENESLKKELEEVKSPSYVEEQARNKLNLARPGEKIVIAPSISPTSSPTPTPVLTRLEKIKAWFKL